jgi:hypothetical protein
MEFKSRHQCLIYEGAPSLQLSVLAAVIQEKLAQGYRCLYLNTPAMVAGLRSYLSAIGVDVVSEVAKSRLILSSESVCLEDGTFDTDSLLNQLETTLDQSLKDGCTGLFATGDMTWEFGAKKNFEKLMDYEYKLELFFQRRPEMHGICQYHKDTLPEEVPRQGLLSHQTLFINQTLARYNRHYVPLPKINEHIKTNLHLDEVISSLCAETKAMVRVATHDRG